MILRGAKKASEAFINFPFICELVLGGPHGFAYGAKDIPQWAGLQRPLWIKLLALGLRLDVSFIHLRRGRPRPFDVINGKLISATLPSLFDLGRAGYRWRT